MCQLLRNGMIAALAPVGVPFADIVVTDEVGDRVCAIQVKTRSGRGGDGGWHMRDKHEHETNPSFFYVFVDFARADDGHIDCFVAPSKLVAEAVRDSHAYWLSQEGRGGHVRKDSKMRRLLPDYDGRGLLIGKAQGWLDPYREAWELIRSSSDIR